MDPFPPHPPNDTPPMKRGLRVGTVLALVVGLVSGCQARSVFDRNRPRVELNIVGQDVDRNRGHTVDVWGRFVSLRQTCRGGCDDVRFVFRVTGEGFPIEVRDGAGRPLMALDAYATTGIANRYSLSGQQGLDLR